MSWETHLLTAILGLCLPACSPGQDVITIDSAITHQTMRGWEVTPSVATPCDPAFAALRDQFIDAAVNDIGIDRVRLEIRSGVENTTDHRARFVASGCAQSGPDHRLWRQNRYATVNDNPDPDLINWDGFHFTELDWFVETVVLPMRQLLEQKGQRLFINLCYVAFTGQITDGSYHHADPHEYAEFLLATYLHLRDKYGFSPDTWEMYLEPNGSDFDGVLLGKALVASANRLLANGFTPGFIAPSALGLDTAITFFDQMITVPGVLQYLEEFSYHRYRGRTLSNLRAIADRGTAHDIPTSMLEWWFQRATYHVLHEDLTVGRNSSWQGSTLDGLFNFDASIPGQPIVKYEEHTRFYRQYFKFVRRGAVRIEAVSARGKAQPTAFVNPDGGVVVVIKAESSVDFTMHGLPPGRYGIKYTTKGAFDVDLPEVLLASGGAVQAVLPRAGVMTVYAVSGGSSSSRPHG